jgi:two-component system chemotaxis response regulator CheY
LAIDPSVSVLVVDDLATMSRIVCTLLRQIGVATIDTATDGADALAKLERRRYDIVISDWNMQPMNGLDLLRRARANTRYNGTCFIMITAEAKPQHVIDAKQAGANAFLVKPFTAQELKLKIEQALTAAP